MDLRIYCGKIAADACMGIPRRVLIEHTQKHYDDPLFGALDEDDRAALYANDVNTCLRALNAADDSKPWYPDSESEMTRAEAYTIALEVLSEFGRKFLTLPARS